MWSYSQGRTGRGGIHGVMKYNDFASDLEYSLGERGVIRHVKRAQREKHVHGEHRPFNERLRDENPV